MTTVADLVAKLGFEVDDSGFKTFKKHLKTFHKLIRNGLRDLKEYANQAERISNAFKNASIPKASGTKPTSKRQPTLASAARYIRGNRALSTVSAFFGSGSLAGNVLGGVGGIIGSLVGKLAGPVGSIIGQVVGQKIGSVLGNTMTKIATFVVGQIRKAIRYFMAYRDYRAFTGRSHYGLNNLMGLATKYTADLTPQDVMKDATRLGQDYWDMWFGGGSPEAWQMLGLIPTMSGERNMKNILARVVSLMQRAGGNTEMAHGIGLKALRMFGLEKYMPIVSKAAMGEQITGTDLPTVTQKEIAEFENLNRIMKTFGDTVEKMRGQFVIWMDKTFGLSNVLEWIVDYLKGLVIALQKGESLKSIVSDTKRIHDMGKMGAYFTSQEDFLKYKTALEQYGLTKDSSYSDVVKAISGKSQLFDWKDLFGPMFGKLSATLLEANRVHNALERVEIVQNFNTDMSGRDLKESTDAVGNLATKSMQGLSQQEFNGATIVVSGG